MNTVEFLQTLYGDATGLLTIWTPDKQTRWFQIPEQLHMVAGFYLPTDIYFGVGLGSNQTKGRLHAEDITCIPGLWMDIDLKSPAHKQTDLPVTVDDCADLFPVIPSIIVH